jgi:hypothetical protein
LNLRDFAGMAATASMRDVTFLLGAAQDGGTGRSK